MKAQTQHTPGPWVIRKAGTTRLVIEGPNSRTVAETIEYIPSEGEATSNARLIALAPEMAEALAALLAADEAICEDIGSKSDQAMQRIAALDTARAILARVNGGGV